MIIRRVSGESMLPNLRPGQLVLARKVRWPVKIGDVIIFKQGIEKIKRVEKVTPAGLFVLGDNPGSSTDSRHFGLVRYQEVVAKIIIPRRHTD